MQTDENGIRILRNLIFMTMDIRSFFFPQRPTVHKVSVAVSSLVERGSIPCLKTKNKGAVGILCEYLTGIPNSSAHLDCSDGEVKVFPLKRSRNGTLVPKETIAVTMLNRSSLTSQATFGESSCCSKLRHVLFVPYLRENDESIRFFNPTELLMTDDMYSRLEHDYDTIRKRFLEDGTLTSSMGVYLQNRTKGPGKKIEKSRAFYLKKEFIDTYITPTW